MLAVVEHEERSPVAQPRDDRLQIRAPALVSHAERRADRVRDEPRFGERRQLHEPHAVLVLVEDARRRLERHARLADPARAHERHQPRLLEPPAHLVDLLLPPHETGDGVREVVGGPLRGGRERDRRGRDVGGDGPERLGEGSDRLMALLGHLGERSQERLFDRRRKVGRELARPARRVVDVLVDDLPHVLSGERPLAGQQLVDHAPDRVDVRPRVGLLAAALLGRDVARRTEHLARVRQPVLERLELRVQPGQPEVDHLDHDRAVALFEEDVLGLEVAVDHARLVRRADRLADLRDDRERRLDVERRALGQRRAERPAFEQLHDEVGADVLRHAVVVHGHDVRMPEPRDGDRLAPEALGEDAVLDQAAADRLERDGALELQVGRAVDVAHSARAEHAVDPVLVVDDQPDAELSDGDVRARGRKDLGRDHAVRGGDARLLEDGDERLDLAASGQVVSARLVEERRESVRLEAERPLGDLPYPLPLQPGHLSRERLRSGMA